MNNYFLTAKDGNLRLRYVNLNSIRYITFERYAADGRRLWCIVFEDMTIMEECFIEELDMYEVAKE
jgi:hypothetical protein